MVGSRDPEINRFARVAEISDDKSLEPTSATLLLLPQAGRLFIFAPERQITNGWRLRGLRPLRRTRRSRVEAGEAVVASKVISRWKP